MLSIKFIGLLAFRPLEIFVCNNQITTLINVWLNESLVEVLFGICFSSLYLTVSCILTSSVLGLFGIKMESLNFYRADNGETWELPAFHALEWQSRTCSSSAFPPRPAVDPTGCGNAFCGGFAIGWWKTRNLLTAGLYGTVSASISKYNI